MLDRHESDALWLVHVREQQLPLRWVGGAISDRLPTTVSAEVFATMELPDDLVDNFIEFAVAGGVTVPADGRSNQDLRSLLAATIAHAKWGTYGYYLVGVVSDPVVKRALSELPRAESLVGR